ncbi:MATE family efflux transporter [Ottowia sp. SB7-C50]|uniref:MATE family efflux transporter n=1 Tax=Ottowia sp. SB7-C50 TaxID=3081231 RepID=UPI0029556A03|nr:MATE family efflux transporter [Ottowia sp. SB7-C50]WOP16368.1 MATE family efflux transporter [Ottowia sp. SB7-C50]
MPSSSVPSPIPPTRAAELRTLGAHAGVVLVGQLAVMAFGITDTVVAGRYAEVALAALSVGTAVYISIYVGLMGILQALLPIWSELHGSQRSAELGRSVRQALYLCAATIVVGMAALLSPGPLLDAAGVPAPLQVEVRRYLAVLAWALPPALLFRMYSTLNQSLGKPRLVSALQIGALGLKIPLSVWFTFGGLGLAPQGAAGCAWATLVVNGALMACGAWLLRTQSFYRPYALWQRLERPDFAQLGAFLRLGLPAGLAVAVEVSSFTAMALFISRMGTTASAAHQIASNMAAVLYMVPLALGIATSARTSYWLGAGQRALARRATWLGLGCAAALAVVMAAALALLARPIAALYVEQPPVIALAAGLLGWVALYHLGDAVQAVTLFVLRSYRVTLVPLLIYGVILWGLGLVGGYRWAFEGFGTLAPWHDPGAFWLASAAALGVVALLFVGLLLRVTRR